MYSTYKGSPVSSQRTFVMFVPVPNPLNDGSVFWMPALFEVHDGVTACPVNHRATPEICQLLNSCFATGVFVSSGMM